MFVGNKNSLWGKKFNELDYFITKWNIAAGDSITLPLTSNGDYNFIIDWGDNSETLQVNSYNSINATHTYAVEGIYQVKISGICSRFDFNSNSAYRSKIVDVMQWGNVKFKLLNFKLCNNISAITALDIPKFKIDALLTHLFADTNLGIVNNIENWDTSNVMSLQRALLRCGTFNQDLSKLNLENCTDFIHFLTGVTLSTAYYDALLISMSNQNMNYGETFYGGNSKYTLGSAAETARNYLINNFGWSFIDGGGI